MNFDARDLMEANLTLLQEAAARPESSPALLVCVATWGRGADPKLLAALAPFRVGLGFNGSVVARLPWQEGLGMLPASVQEALADHVGEDLVVCSGVFKDWQVLPWSALTGA